MSWEGLGVGLCVVKSLDWRIFRNIMGAVLLLLIAIMAPFFAVAVFEVWRPGADSLGQWVERSGAVMTLYSAIAAAVSKVSVDLIGQSGEIGYRAMSTLTRKYHRTAQAIENLSLLITLVGAIVWGYGSFIVAGYMSFQRYLDNLSLPAVC